MEAVKQKLLTPNINRFSRNCIFCFNIFPTTKKRELNQISASVIYCIAKSNFSDIFHKFY